MPTIQVEKWKFKGYDKSLFKSTNTLSYILENLKIDKVTSVSDSSSNPWSYISTQYSINRLVNNGSIPFIWAKVVESNGVYYLKKLGAFPAASNSDGAGRCTFDSVEYRVRWDSGSPDHQETTDRNFNDTFRSISYSTPDSAGYLSKTWVLPEFGEPFTWDLNIPIFLVDNSWNESLTSQMSSFMIHNLTPDELILADTNVIGILSEEAATFEEETYEFSTIARNYTVDQYGNKTENESEGERYRGLRIKIKGRVSLYKIPGINDGSLKYGINISTTPIICYSSNDYGKTWTNVPGQPTVLPFDFMYRPYEEEDGTGTFWAAVGDGDNKNLLIFDNEEDSDEYNNDPEDDGRKASNYNEINSGDFNNPTGDEDEGTEFGEVKTRGFFSQQYIMNEAALIALANDLFDTSLGGIWEAIKQGLDMYGDNPIEAVMGLSFWPLDLTSVFSGIGSAAYIWFGGYGWDTSGHGSVSKITYPNGSKTLGSLAIRRTFRNWRDYAPYTRLYVSLPYCGVYELDLTRYYDKTVEVRYFFDTRTNGCIAALIADGHLMDYFNGQMGVTMPITLTDYAGYANSQIATLLGAGALAAVAATGVGAAVAGAGSAALGLAGTAVGTSGLAGAAAAAGAAGAAGGAVGIGLGGAAVAGTALGAKTAYGLSQNNINKHNVTKGGSSSMINEYLPQYVEFIFEIQEDCAPDNYGQQYGYPSMKSGSVGSFQGFLKCQSVKLDCGVATENEKNQIKTMLLNGIYI